MDFHNVMNLHKNVLENFKIEAAKVSASLSGKIDKYGKTIEQGKFSYSPKYKAFEKQIKKMEIKE